MSISEMLQVRFESGKAKGELGRLLKYGPRKRRDDEGNEVPSVAVRKEINLAFVDPEDLYQDLAEFLRECEFDEEAELELDGTVLHLSGERKLTLEEYIEFQKGLFE